MVTTLYTLIHLLCDSVIFFAVSMKIRLFEWMMVLYYEVKQHMRKSKLKLVFLEKQCLTLKTNLFVNLFQIMQHLSMFIEHNCIMYIDTLCIKTSPFSHITLTFIGSLALAFKALLLCFIQYSKVDPLCFTELICNFMRMSHYATSSRSEVLLNFTFNFKQWAL